MENSPETMELIQKYFSNFTEKQLQQFAQLYELYIDWNAKINVVSRKDIDSLYERHVLHSLSIAAQYPFGRGIQVIDIGTGGGFPGIPLAIFFPEVEFHLVDSIAKKIRVVEAIASTLHLSNLSAAHTRAEDIKGRKFDFAVSRAVAPIKDLWRWSKPLLRNERKIEDFNNGLICLKGGDLADEISVSGLRPNMTEVHSLFPEPYFQGKFIVYVPI
jgi:16S rRNA (guanine527-N7)-methyltransferase